MPDMIVAACTVVLALAYLVLVIANLYDVGRTIRVTPGHVLVYAALAILTFVVIGRAWGWW